jgi:hypothetical protein
VSESLPLLKPHIQSWLREQLIEPRVVRLATDPDGKVFKQLWLITDHVGENDSSYRIVYDASSGTFGLECTLDSGVEWYMGNYGSFPEAVEAM